MAEKPVVSPLYMDRSDPLGNSLDQYGRRTLHVRQTSGSLVTEPYNQISASYPDDVTEVYQYLLDSVLQATVTVTYVDDTKELLASVEKTLP